MNSLETVPPWLRNDNKSGNRINRRKPIRRVPITAPPTTIPTTTTPMPKLFPNTQIPNSGQLPSTESTFTIDRDKSKFEEAEKVVSAAPVYYESNFKDQRKEKKESQNPIRKNEKEVVKVKISEVKCKEQRARGVNWPQTEADVTAENSCPNSEDTTASWHCSLTGLWATPSPDLSQCRSRWIVNLLQNLKTHSYLSRIAEELDQQLTMYPLFGGDILATLDIVKGAVDQMRQGLFDKSGSKDDPEFSVLVIEVIGKLVRSLSTLLEDKSRLAWLDLSPILRRDTVNRFMSLAEDLGSVVPLLTKLPVPDGATIISRNLCK